MAQHSHSHHPFSAYLALLHKAQLAELHIPLVVEHIRLGADNHSLGGPEHLVVGESLRDCSLALASSLHSVEVGNS